MPADIAGHTPTTLHLHLAARRSISNGDARGGLHQPDNVRLLQPDELVAIVDAGHEFVDVDARVARAIGRERGHEVRGGEGAARHQAGGLEGAQIVEHLARLFEDDLTRVQKHERGSLVQRRDGQDAVRVLGRVEAEKGVLRKGAQRLGDGGGHLGLILMARVPERRSQRGEGARNRGESFFDLKGGRHVHDRREVHLWGKGGRRGEHMHAAAAPRPCA